jgi:hypothetical protein
MAESEVLRKPVSTKLNQIANDFGPMFEEKTGVLEAEESLIVSEIAT